MVMIGMSSWVRSRGKANKADMRWVFVIYHPTMMKRQLNIVYATGKSFTVISPFSQWGLQLTRCLLKMQYSGESRSFLECVEDNFLT